MKSGRLKTNIKETEWLLFILCAFASAFGILMIYSATKHALTEGQFMNRDCLLSLIGSALGIIICVWISFADYDSFLGLSPIIGSACVLLMLSLFIWGKAPADRPDAICWLRFGSGSHSFSFQPSELVKIGFIITFSAHLDKVKDDINSIKNVLLLCVHGAIPTGLVVLTGDVGSALVFAVIFVGLMFAAGVSLKYFAIALVGIIVSVPVLWLKFFSDYQRNRFLAVYNPDALEESVYNAVIYQQQRGLNAIGSGMFKGDGFLKGTYTQIGYVPVSESDMIFTVIGEELGFIGCVLVLLLMFFIAVRLIMIGKKSRNLSGYLLCFGTSLMIISQVIINIGMCLCVMPCIGITLPFISSGGSADLCIYLGIGVAMSVYRHNCSREPVSFRVRSISTPYKEF